jgi:hypothetical protein
VLQQQNDLQTNTKRKVMQTTATDKVYYYVSGFLLYVCMILIVWTVSPISFLKPDTRVGATPAVQVAHTTFEFGKPIRIVVPEVGIDLPVVDGYYDTSDGQWTIGNHKAFYATPTPEINDRMGTTLIYGHNNRTAFHKLLSIPSSATLTIYTDKGSIFHYVYTHASQVNPSDTSLLALRGRPKVALQTCSGNWNEWRKLFMFQLTAVEKTEQQNA